jgi:arylsulfatase A-like enzyme
MRSHTLLLVLIALAFAAAPARAVEPAFGRRPNIILVLTDDQGYGDLACNGNPVVKTPNIDALYKRSVRFTNFHVSPTCAPTRAALLTGRHEFHGGVTHTINERERLRPDATIYPQVLKTAGYATGIFGKWHLGDEDDHQPEKRGFDEVFIHGAGGIGQTYAGSCGDAPGNTYFDAAIKHNGTFVRTRGYCTDVFFHQALTWIEARRAGNQPFYAHIATNAPHEPLQCPERYVQMYKGKVTDKQAAFFGMITNIDDNVGRLVAKLKELGIERNTLLIFMTDNGGTGGVDVFNAGMRGMKVTPYEGGTRVPLFMCWPGTLKEDVDVAALTAHVDLFATFAEVIGTSVAADWQRKMEGRSLVPLLKANDATWPDRILFTHVGRWDRGQAAQWKYRNASVRNARYSLVSVPTPQQVKATPGGEVVPAAWELFDLQTDPGQRTNVASQHAEVVRELSAAFEAWWTSVLPDLVNEDVPLAAANPFKVQYWKQFGDGP